jgi:hypothetical protein
MSLAITDLLSSAKILANARKDHILSYLIDTALLEVQPTALPLGSKKAR